MPRSPRSSDRSTDRCNVVVVSGVVTREPERRTLPSGSVVVQFDVTTDVPDGAARTSVPCAWLDPPARAEAILDAGLDVVVLGSVRRRFFRSGGTTASRTEVVVERAVPSRPSRPVDRLVERARRALSRVGGSPGR